MSSLLECRGLEAGYGGIKVLWGVSLEVKKGEAVAVLGPNGAGKSTLLKAIVGLVRPTAGRVLFEGEDVTREPPHRKARRGLVLVPEGRGLFPDMSVMENLLVGAGLLRERGALADRLELVFRLFPILRERANQKAKTLSGGEQQMLAIAKALVSSPKLLMLDEPTLGLSPKLSSEIARLVKRLRDETGVSILLVEEKIKHALEVADRVYIMNQGRIEHELSRDELAQKESLIEKYLGI